MILKLIENVFDVDEVAVAVIIPIPIYLPCFSQEYISLCTLAVEYSDR